jgi:hypothetical protein
MWQYLRFGDDGTLINNSATNWDPEALSALTVIY